MQCEQTDAPIWLRMVSSWSVEWLDLQILEVMLENRGTSYPSVLWKFVSFDLMFTVDLVAKDVVRKVQGRIALHKQANREMLKSSFHNSS